MCAALGTFTLILTVYQAAHGKLTSSAALGAAFVVCGLFVFIPQLKAFKVWGVEAELKETIDRAEEILGKLRRLSLISAKASYMSSAWSSRMSSPSAKDTQTILDETGDVPIAVELRRADVARNECYAALVTWATGLIVMRSW